MATETATATPMLVNRKDAVLVKPSKPTPSEILSFSTIDDDYNLEILCQTIYVYQPNTISSNTNDHDPTPTGSCQADPVRVIKEALSKVLVHYYPLAGRLKRHEDGRLRLICNADGVPFLEAVAGCELSSLHYLDGIDVETAQKFVFDVPVDPGTEINGDHPLVLQVTNFSCGGFTIGMGLSHTVCDGFGASQFFRALAEFARGKSEPSVKPVWERQRLVAAPSNEPFQFPMDNASATTSPYLPSTDLVHECFSVSSESIRRLKMSLLTQKKVSGKEVISNAESFTTLEVLGAYVWRSRFRALKLNSDGKTMFSCALGIRRMLNPSLPDGYYGNAFVSANVIMLGKDLDEGPLSAVVEQIKEGKRSACSTEHVWNLISILESVRQQNMRINIAGGGATMVLTDWRQLGLLEEVDFGWKGAVNMIPVPWNMFGYVGLCIFMPPTSLDPAAKGGVRILVCLPRVAMSKFREEIEVLTVEKI